MASPFSHSWYRLHWQTWVVAAVGVAMLLCRQLEQQVVFSTTGLGMLTEYAYFGWPFAYLDQEQWQKLSTGFRPPPESVYGDLQTWRLCGNLAVSACLVIATSIVVERWIRSESRVQFGLRSLVLAVFVLAFLVTMFKTEWKLPYRDWPPEDFQMTWSIIEESDFANPLRWPILFAISCTIYAAGWLTWQLAVCSWRGASRLVRSSHD